MTCIGNILVVCNIIKSFLCNVLLHKCSWIFECTWHCTEICLLQGWKEETWRLVSLHFKMKYCKSASIIFGNILQNSIIYSTCIIYQVVLIYIYDGKDALELEKVYHISTVKSTPKNRSPNVIHVCLQTVLCHLQSPKSLRWPIAMGWPPSLSVVHHLLTSYSQELLG